uniref:Uncharacterized protein n=1 Tax=Anopheles atroparvus TaxID=41427 RepID=A0A182J3Q1_ANOAO
MAIVAVREKAALAFGFRQSGETPASGVTPKMNSVFSAFKSSSSSSASSSTVNGNANGGGGVIGTAPVANGGKHETGNGTVLTNGVAGSGAKSASKLLLNIKTHRPAVADHPPNSSYEKLRHIREISCTNRNNNLVGTLDRTSSSPQEENPSVATTPVQSPTTLDEIVSNGIATTSPSSLTMNGIMGAAGPRAASANGSTSGTNSSSSSNTTTSNGLGSATLPPRFHKPRLSLSSSSSSGLGLSTASMPAVHGRTAPNAGSGTSSGMPPPKTRLSTHQRNLSLDFRVTPLKTS